MVSSEPGALQGSRERSWLWQVLTESALAWPAFFPQAGNLLGSSGSLGNVALSCMSEEGWMLGGVGRACHQPARHLVSQSCQHQGAPRSALVVRTSQKALFLTPAAPLLHPSPWPLCSEVGRWAAPEMTHAYLQGRAALVPRPW